MLLPSSSHRQRSVGDLVGLALVGSKGQHGGSTPLLALYDRSDAALLVCGVGHGQGVGVRAAH